MSKFEPSPSLPAPISTIGPIAWVRKNLFSSIANTAVTLFCIYLLSVIIPPILEWAFFNADWSGTTEADCSKDGACWVFIGAWFNQLIYGDYPIDQQWRINIVLFALLAIISMQYLLPDDKKKTIGLYSFIAFPFVAMAILYGGFLGLEVVDNNYWGGFTLNIFLATGGILMALPIGVFWALGRRSDMPLIRIPSIISIEVFRGVPLITILFMGSVMLPLFFSAGTEIDKLLRAFIMITLFQSAYMAEVIRGGLQAIPQGQYEAADALGLGYWQKMYLIILPQALKISIPNIVNTFIALFKDTTLVLIIGLFEILSVSNNALQNSKWLGGHHIEGYVFVALMFWVCCFIMSRISVSIEEKLNTGHKR